ncbi:hypothetical protein [Candidatus Liberibacter sp.]|nr:hypothetical protein [Candidatus Liberibacter sp.]MBA5723698.1 hypothetical protein [Candidatus Liberibacter sp.]
MLSSICDLLTVIQGEEKYVATDFYKSRRWVLLPSKTKDATINYFLA